MMNQMVWVTTKMTMRLQRTQRQKRSLSSAMMQDNKELHFQRYLNKNIARPKNANEQFVFVLKYLSKIIIRQYVKT